MRETMYSHRTDDVNEKIRLLRLALGSANYDLARSLAESIKDTITFSQQVNQDPGPADFGAGASRRVEELPDPWRRWARGWTYYGVVTLDETVGLARRREPVELRAAFPVDETSMLARELRVARIDPERGTLHEIPCQVMKETLRGERRHCRLLFLADTRAHVRSQYLVFHGNPGAEMPAYVTDLEISGEGYKLDIENDYYRASLSRQMGQLERLTLKHDHGLELFSAGNGHGEPPGIDWAHDYVTSGAYQKMRVTNWAECPNYEVIRGPLCAVVRRWGFPHSTVHPLFTPSRMHIDVEYRFYAGVPYLMKQGAMEVIKDLDITYLRDDEWVFSGHPFTGLVWMASDGKLRIGPVEERSKDDLWSIGFFNRQSRNAFIALFLVHEAENFDGLKHAGAPTLNYQNHGQIWSRWAARDNPHLPAGTRLRQKNAYLVLPFDENDGPRMVENFRHQLLNPLAVSQGERADVGRARESTGRLARRGEAGDTSIPKRAVWDALREVRDDQLYKVDANVVDMGYVYDVRIRDDVVLVLLTMPHRGRPKYGFIGEPIRKRLRRLDGVREVRIEPIWDPPWDANRMTPKGRQALGF